MLTPWHQSSVCAVLLSVICFVLVMSVQVLLLQNESNNEQTLKDKLSNAEHRYVFIVTDVEKVKGKSEHLYSTLHGFTNHLKVLRHGSHSF